MMGRTVRLAAVASVVAALTFATTSASAAPAYTPTGLCGSGYRVVDSGAASTYVTVYLLYNSGNGYNCVVAIKGSSTAGTSHPMNTYLEVKAGAYGHNAGLKTYYAGPVRLYARGKCVMWGGYVNANGPWYGAERRLWEHCG